MVHKRYVKRNGKIFGPYYYKTVRGKDGKVRSIYLGSTTPSSKKETPKNHVAFALTLVFILLSMIFAFGDSLFMPTGAVVTIESDGNVMEQGYLMEKSDEGYSLNAKNGNDEISIENIVDEPEAVNVEFNSPASKVFNTKIVAVTGLSSASATIELEKTGAIEAIFYCPDYDSQTNICPKWEKTSIPFETEGEKITFNAEHFSAYTAGSDSALNISDDTDLEIKKSYNPDEVESKWNVTFYANYSNSTVGPIMGDCQIRFQNYSGSYDEGFVSMTYSATERRYVYSRNFTYDGTYDFEVSCTNSTYDNLDLTDTYTITNRPPYSKYEVQHLPPQECEEDTICTYDFSENVSDYDLNDLPLENYTYAQGTDFNCFNLDASTGLITINCDTDDDAGNYKTTLLVTDQDGESTTAVYNITITAVNDYPYFTTTSPLTSATEDVGYSSYVDVFDEEQGSITSGSGAIGNFSYTINDSSIFTINRSTGLLTNNTALLNDLVGTYYIELNVTDSATPTNATNSTTFEITVENQNDLPNLFYACNESLNQKEDVPFSCYLNATDIDVGQTHTYTANYTWFNFSCANVAVTNGNTSCLVNFAPNDSAVYSHWINITVADNDGGQDSIVINFTVNNTEDIPYFSNISNMTAWANAPFWYQIEASDDDNATQFGETLYYWDNTSLFNISTTDGIISFTPTDAQVDTYWINLSVNDSTNNWNSTIINFTINNNSIPLYDGNFHFNMTEGYVFELNVSLNSSDPDGHSLSYADNSSMFNISDEGYISFTPSDSDVGTNWVSINITDQYGATNETMLNLTVYNEQDEPSLSTISNITNATEGIETTFTLTASDDDLFVPNTTEYLRYSMNSTVTGMSLDSVTGAFSWTPSATQSGFYWINFTVNDTAGNEDSQVMYINVTDAAFPPRFIESHPDFCTVQNATEDEPFASCKLIACDNDTDAVLTFAANYSWFNDNINTSEITGLWNPAYGYCINTTLNFTPEYTEVGNYTVLLNVTDFTGSYDTLNLSFNISSKNDAPVLDPIGNQNPVVDRPYSYDVNATDEENHTLTYSANATLEDVGTNATINSSTGIISLTPNTSHLGVYWVNISVSDSYGGVDYEIVRFLVGANSIPTCSDFLITTPDKTITSSPDAFNISENQSTGNFIPTCSDIEGDDFTYRWYWNGSVNASGIYPTGKNWNYTPNYLQAGNVNVTLVVNDSATQSNSYYWNVTVFNVNAPPMMYKDIPNITKMPTWISSSAWYKNRDSYINLSEYFFDYDEQNLTFSWYWHAINQSFTQNNLGSLNSTWNFSGSWVLTNDTANNPALLQNSSSGLNYASDSSYVDITEVSTKIKIRQGGVAGLCLGDADCDENARRVYFNFTDNTTNIEYRSNASVEHLNNTFSLAMYNTSYAWLKAEFDNNNVLVYVSGNGQNWNMTYNDSLSMNASSSTLSLFTIDSIAVFDDVVVKDPVIPNMDFTYSEEGDKVTFSPDTDWSGDVTAVFVATDGMNESVSNLFGLHIDDVSEPEPVVVTRTQTSSSTSRVTQVASLEIIVPSMVSLTPLSKTIVPVILHNSGQLTLNKLDLMAITNQTELGLFLEETNWTTLAVGERKNTNLEIDIGLLTPDRYTISLIGNSQSPKLTEKVDIVIDVREKDAVLKAQLKEQIQFTRDLFLQNPECLELWELIEEAENLMSQYQYEQGLEVIHSANQGCKDFMALDSEKLSPAKIKSFFQLYWKTILFEAIGLVLAILLLVYYFKRRRFRKTM